MDKQSKNNPDNSLRPLDMGIIEDVLKCVIILDQHLQVQFAGKRIGEKLGPDAPAKGTSFIDALPKAEDKASL